MKMEHRHHVRIDAVDTVKEHAVGIGYERIDFSQLLTRDSKSGPVGASGTPLLTTRISNR
jgi:hypothetical protein